MIGFNGAFDNGGVCGDGVRCAKCSSLIIDIAGDGATSSRSPSIDGITGIWASVDGTGGVAEARGDNSGDVGVEDIFANWFRF